MTIETLFDQLKDFRKEIYVPVILMGYMNPVLQFGFEKFCKHAADMPVDGLILPDFPGMNLKANMAPLLSAMVWILFFWSHQKHLKKE